MKKMGIFKCKIKDLCEDLETLGVREISLDITGGGLAIADYLKEKGVKVNAYRNGKRIK